AYERLLALGDPNGAAREALARLEAAHLERLAAHRARAEAQLEGIRGSDRVNAAALDEALSALKAAGDEATQGRIVAELDRLTQVLRQVEERALLSAEEPTPAEAKAGQLKLLGLRDALDARYRTPHAALGERDVAAVQQALDRLEARRRDAYGERALRAQIAVGEAQREALGPGRRALARLLCRSLEAAPSSAPERAEGLRAALGFAALANHPELALPALLAGCELAGGDPEAQAFLRARAASFGRESRCARFVAGKLAELEERAGPQTAETQGAQGARSLALGDAAGAVAFYTRALELEPTDVGALVGLARGQLLADALGEAWQALERALQRAPERPDVWTLRAEVSLRRGELGKVGPAATRAIELDAEYAPAYAVRAEGRLRQGELDAALTDVSAAVRLDPRFAQAFALRSEVLLARREFAEAASDASRAIEADAELPAGYLARGRVILAAPQPAQAQPERLAALADLGQALRLDPGLAEAWALRGHARFLLGDLTGAKLDLEHALGLEERPRAWNELARVQLSLGETDRARESYGRSLSLAEQPEVFAERARLAAAAGDTVSALRDLEAALRLRKDDVGLLMQRADVLIQAGDLTRASLDLHEVLRLAPGSPEAARAQQLLDGAGGR
ncbi:MAG: tetratricopeptide repeat protein, partial [Planctomycetes bacterium]|nr:tetratricopeptide repeat protein [Planctomycetota bacterium]